MTGKEPCCAITYLPHTVCPTCRRCVAGCPAQIDIPRALQIYVDYRGSVAELSERLRELPNWRQPLDCIMCGASTTHCPQGIDVRCIMRELSRRRW